MVATLYQNSKANARTFFTAPVIYLSREGGQYCGMAIDDIRRENARALAKKAGGPARFAEKTGMSDSQVSQIIGKNPTKNIGGNLARKIEEALSLPRGWMDTPEGGNRLVDVSGPNTAGFISVDELTRLVTLYEKAAPGTREMLLDALEGAVAQDAFIRGRTASD